jgi:hypothetical protein
MHVIRLQISQRSSENILSCKDQISIRVILIDEGSESYCSMHATTDHHASADTAWYMHLCAEK